MTGSNGLEWDTADVIQKGRMNWKTLFVGTGAQIDALTTYYAGQKAFCTTTGSGFVAGKNYQRNSGNTAWELVVPRDQQAYLKLSTTIGDYTSPAVATASSESSEGTGTETNTTGGTAGFTLYSLGAIRRGEKAETASSALIGKTPTAVSFWLRKVGSPTGTLTVTQRASDDTIKHTFGTLDVSTLTGTFAKTTFTSTGATMAENDRILAEYSGGDGSNYVEMDAKETTNPYDSTDSVATAYVASWSDSATSDVKFEMPYSLLNSAENAIDNVTTTRWQSNSEANPNIYVDLSSDREIVALAVHLDRTNTTVTSLKIRASIDTTFTDAENIAYVDMSDFTDDTWRFLATNFLADNRRYVQFYANETGVLAINEIKVRYGVSDANKIIGLRVGTRFVDAADSFVDSN